MGLGLVSGGEAARSFLHVLVTFQELKGCLGIAHDDIIGEVRPWVYLYQVIAYPESKARVSSVMYTFPRYGGGG